MSYTKLSRFKVQRRCKGRALVIKGRCGTSPGEKTNETKKRKEALEWRHC